MEEEVKVKLKEEIGGIIIMLSPIAVTSTIVKSKDEAYGYDYDTDGEHPASMVRAHSSVGDNDDSVIVKVKEEAYEYDTDNEHLASTVRQKSSTGDDGDTSKHDEDWSTAEKATTHDNHASTKSEDNRRRKKKELPPLAQVCLQRHIFSPMVTVGSGKVPFLQLQQQFLATMPLWLWTKKEGDTFCNISPTVV